MKPRKSARRGLSLVETLAVIVVMAAIAPVLAHLLSTTSASHIDASAARARTSDAQYAADTAAARLRAALASPSVTIAKPGDDHIVLSDNTAIMRSGSELVCEAPPLPDATLAVDVDAFAITYHDAAGDPIANVTDETAVARIVLSLTLDGLSHTRTIYREGARAYTPSEGAGDYATAFFGVDAVTEGAMVIQNAELYGKALAGATLSVSQSSVGSTLSDAPPVDTIGAAESISLDRSNIYNGDVRAPVITYNNTSNAPQGVIEESPPTQNPATMAADFTAFRDAMVSLPDPTVVTKQWSALQFQGADDVNVFSCSAHDLRTATSANIQVPAGATAIIIITGGDAEFRSMGVNLSGATPRTTLWILEEGDEVFINSVTVYGGIVAPGADVTVTSAQVHGGIYSRTLSLVGGSVHMARFTGDLPE